MTKKLWIKLWPDLLLGSGRWRRVNVYESGIYFQILVRADEEGGLRTGSLPWTAEYLADDLEIDRRRMKKLENALDKLVRLDLLYKHPKDGAFCISRHERLQAQRK
jgi:hypothetical protein